VVRKYFDFLLKLGFQCTSKDDANPVRYENASQYIEIWLGQGDNDVLFGDKTTAKFVTLQQWIRNHHPGKFPLLAEFPRKPNSNEDEHYLSYAAHWIKTYYPHA